MDRQQWYDERDNRSLRYAERRLDSRRWLAITVSPAYLRRFDGQVAVLTAANLFGRMTPSVALSFPDVPVHSALPWSGRSLHETALAQMRAADPYGQFAIRDRLSGDYRVHLGPEGADNLIHGAGWNAHVGSGLSPLPDADERNCFGGALAVVLAASQIFLHEFVPPSVPFTCNALNWRNEAASDAPACPLGGPLGKIWVAGAGSVGTAALYFLTLATRDFAVALIDHDRVKIHNLDRSPIFVAADIGQFKVDAAHKYLRGVGVREILADARPLHESRLWNERQPGEPDLLISAANEMKVRYYIEAGYPPRQLYGTTGQNWQAAVIRHEPFGKACSLCLFPADQASASTACATAPAETSTRQVEHVDAALPFLSFAAGLMAAAEAVKTRLPGYPFSQDRVILNTRPETSLISAPLAHRDGCFCETRNAQLHQTMLRARVRANTP